MVIIVFKGKVLIFGEFLKKIVNSMFFFKVSKLIIVIG